MLQRSQRLFRVLQIDACLIDCCLRSKSLFCQNSLAFILQLVKRYLVLGLDYLSFYALIILFKRAKIVGNNAELGLSFVQFDWKGAGSSWNRTCPW